MAELEKPVVMSDTQFKELLSTFKNDTTGNVADAQVPHGLNYPGTATGLFYNPGSRADMFSALLRPQTLAQRLFLNGVTNEVQPQYDIITGRTAARGTNPSDYCGTPMKGGYAKLCTHKSFFGEAFFGTDNNVLPKMGGRLNGADIERTLRNNPGLYPFVPDILKSGAGSNVNLTEWVQLYMAALQFEESLEKVLVTGNRSVAPGAAEAFFMKEFDGLDLLIKTGYVDDETGNLCTAVDSIVETWGTSITGTKTIQGTAFTFVQFISNIVYRLDRKADLAGLKPWRFFLAMNPDMFDAITAMWPCSYYTDGCIVNNSGTDRNNLDAVATINERDAMRDGKYLMIRGQRIEVVLVDAIETTAVGNGLSAPIYLIPDTVLGGVRPTYLEFFDENNMDIRAWNAIAGADKYVAMNGGMFAATWRLTGFCNEYLFASQPRAVLRTPYLAARIEGVQFQLPGYSASPFPSGRSFVDGGRTFGSTHL